ncbi:MAG: hypothetical protein COB10_07820 [Planctomycetota bacterium]|nr:MAG: hypothetical protein COB10_07820 [Planctomycetota bacterium]
MSSSAVGFDSLQHRDAEFRLRRQPALLQFVLLLHLSFITVALAGQVPPDESEHDPFGRSFSDSSTESDNPSGTPSSLTIDRSGRVTLIGPDMVPHLIVTPRIRVQLLGGSELQDGSDPVDFQGSDLLIEGSALESNHFRFRADLDGLRSPGTFSEAWIDRRIGTRLHLTTGRIPNALGLQGGIPLEDRLTISPGVLDWIDEGSSWALRAGGLWLDDAISADLQARLGGAADLRGEFFGGQGFAGRLSVQPFAPLLFGGPGAIDSSHSAFSMFIAGRWDHDLDGHFQIESPGESTIYRTQNLQMDSARWVRAGWRWPVLDWLHLENEWSRAGFFGVETNDPITDFPGELDGWQLGIRLLPFSDESLAIRSGPDLPPRLFDASSPHDRKDLEVLVRYEKADLGDELQQLGLLEAGTDAGGVEVFRLGICSRPSPWFRWLLEGTRTCTKGGTSSFDGLEVTSIRLMFEFGG